VEKLLLLIVRNGFPPIWWGCNHVNRRLSRGMFVVVYSTLRRCVWHCHGHSHVDGHILCPREVVPGSLGSSHEVCAFVADAVGQARWPARSRGRTRVAMAFCAFRAHSASRRSRLTLFFSAQGIENSHRASMVSFVLICLSSRVWVSCFRRGAAGFALHPLCSSRWPLILQRYHRGSRNQINPTRERLLNCADPRIQSHVIMAFLTGL
jgi:hypothetical protein